MSPPAPELRAARRAVATLFVLNALTYANVVPRLPAIKADLGLSNTSLGTALAAMPVGALLSGPAAGFLVARFGSGTVAAGCGVGFGLVLPGFAVAPSWGGLAATFLVLGALDSLMDVSMNAHALRVQRGFGRSIINALHGLWSVGAVLGGLAGAAAAGTDLDLGVHLSAAGAIVVLVATAARRWLLPGDDEADRAEDDAGREERDVPARRRAGRRRLALLGLVVVMSAIVEDAPQSWGAVFLRDDLGTSAAVASLVYLTFQGAMTVSRLLGDRLVDRRGEVAAVRWGGVLTAVAVGAGLASGEPAAMIVGFGLAGLGTAFLFPVVFHAAGHVPGIATGQGVAAAAWMGRVGFLVGPPVVGLIGDAVSLRAGLVVVPVAGVAIAALAPVTSTAAPAVNADR